jgi:WG containing repeat
MFKNNKPLTFIIIILAIIVISLGSYHYFTVPNYQEIPGEKYYNNLKVVKKNDKYSIIDKSGKLITQKTFDKAEPELEFIGSVVKDQAAIKDPTVVVQIGGKYGILKSNGDYLIEPKYDSVGYIFEGIVKVEVAKKYGFIDTTNGKTILEPIAELAGDFKDGQTYIEINGTPYWLTKDGKREKLSERINRQLSQ